MMKLWIFGLSYYQLSSYLDRMYSKIASILNNMWHTLSLAGITEYCDELAKIRLQSSTSAVVVHSRGISLLFCF